MTACDIHVEVKRVTWETGRQKDLLTCLTSLLPYTHTHDRITASSTENAPRNFTIGDNQFEFRLQEAPGLNVGDTYDVTVSASNSIGPGLPSNISMFTITGSSK